MCAQNANVQRNAIVLEFPVSLVGEALLVCKSPQQVLCCRRLRVDRPKRRGHDFACWFLRQECVWEGSKQTWSLSHHPSCVWLLLQIDLKIITTTVGEKAQWAVLVSRDPHGSKYHVATRSPQPTDNS